MRGLVSNEAGCGTAPAAHATAEVDLPARQGLFGLVEVFVDTVLLCTVTALAILVSDSGAPLGETNAVAVASDAFSSVLGDFAGWFFSLSILLFGVATVICWAHYGKTCLSYLTARLSPAARRTVTGIYSVLFSLSPLAGAMASPTLAWTLADVAIALMTLLNLGVLLLMAGEVKEETDILLGRKR
jgi:AGCS family alanine or glycine:cation symporter